jgi:hypothetical protein
VVVKSGRHKRPPDAGELEGKMLQTSEWHKVPSHIIDTFHEEIEAGYPIGFGFDEDLGWFVLMCGQGPFLAWCEREDG